MGHNADVYDPPPLPRAVNLKASSGLLVVKTTSESELDDMYTVILHI